MRNVYLTLQTSVAILLLLFCQVALSQPVITSFSPTNGPVGTTVTITGTGFDTGLNNNIVYFGAVRASVQSATVNTLTVTVPAGATYAPVTVTTNQLTAYSRLPFNVTFANGGAPFDSTSFVPTNDIIRFTQGRDVLVVDLNGDSRSDLFVTNQAANVATVLGNTSVPGTISFGQWKIFTVGLSYFGSAAGDFDGDGKPDVAIAKVNNGLAGSVSVLRNSSVGDSINFTISTYATGNSTTRVAISDVDQDGKPDLLAVNSNSFTISVFRNTTTTIGNITFDPRVDINAGFGVQDLAIGDIDGDGKVDLASTNAGTLSTMCIWRNLSTPGTISFAPKVSFPSVTNPSLVKMGDLNGDGKLDMVVSNYALSNLSIFRNRSTSGNILFDARQDFPTGIHPQSMRIEDMNGDDKPDIAVTADTPSTITLFRNVSISDTIRLASPVGYGVTPLPLGVGTGDFDNDGKPDMAVTNGYNKVTVLRNRQNEPITAIYNFTPTSARAGTQVTIFGQHFTGVTAVRFGGLLADSMVVLSDTVIEAIVGLGATGNVSVTAPNGTATKSGFTFIGDSPVITTFSPTSARRGMQVTIVGSHFTGANSVKFGGIPARNLIVMSDTVIKALVDTGATGNVSVTTPYGIASKAGFTFIPPVIPPDTTNLPDSALVHIYSFSPTSGQQGSEITIFGDHFSFAQAVRFGGVNASSYTVLSDTVIKAIVGSGASGYVLVNTLSSGMASKPGFTFIADTTGIPDTLFAYARAGVDMVNTTTGTKSFALYPNPASGYVIWQQPATDHITRLQLFDISGRIVRTFTVGKRATQSTIPVSGLPTGMYKLVWSDGKNKLTRSLLIK